MSINGRKISSKYFLTLIFTAIFFSVTFNSPANYSYRTRFCQILTSSSDTAKPRLLQRKPGLAKEGSTFRPDTIPRNIPLNPADTSLQRRLLQGGDSLQRALLRGGDSTFRDSLRLGNDTIPDSLRRAA